jgi:hypothetical protein
MLFYLEKGPKYWNLQIWKLHRIFIFHMFFVVEWIVFRSIFYSTMPIFFIEV